jgi:hypothetical protein
MPHSHPIGQLYTAGSLFSLHPHRPRRNLPTSAGYIYCLTAVNRFTRWPEVIPIPYITADTVAHALLTGWISHFSYPQTGTTEQGHQFESQLLHSLAKPCGIQLSRTTTHHPAANGLMVRFYRALKAAIMCHADQEALPLVLLRIHTAFKEDLQASVAELVYGEPLRIPDKLLTPTSDPADPGHLITKLRQHTACLRPIPATRHASPDTFVHGDLEKCTSSSVRTQCAERWGPLQWPIPGPVMERENTANPCAQQAHHRVNRHGQTGLHAKRDWPWDRRHLNPAADTTPATAPHATPPPPVA